MFCTPKNVKQLMHDYLVLPIGNPSIVFKAQIKVKQARHERLNLQKPKN